MLSIQKPKESTWDYIQRWAPLCNLVEGVTEGWAILSFQQGVRYEHLRLKLGRMEITTIRQLMGITNRYSNGEENDKIRKGEPRQQPTNQKGKRSKLEEWQEQVLPVGQ